MCQKSFSIVVGKGLCYCTDVSTLYCVLFVCSVCLFQCVKSKMRCYLGIDIWEPDELPIDIGFMDQIELLLVLNIGHKCCGF